MYPDKKKKSPGRRVLHSVIKSSRRNGGGDRLEASVSATACWMMKRMVRVVRRLSIKWVRRSSERGYGQSLSYISESKTMMIGRVTAEDWLAVPSSGDPIEADDRSGFSGMAWSRKVAIVDFL